MRYFTLTALCMVFLLSCKKEINTGTIPDANALSAFFQQVREGLIESLSPADYASLDQKQFFRSRDAQSDGCFVRIAFRNKAIGQDFILLRTDSSGAIREGRIIHVAKDSSDSEIRHSFTGRFTVQSLHRDLLETRDIVSGKWKRNPAISSLVAEQPAGTQTLPEVVVTTYTSSGSWSGDWYFYGSFFTYDYNTSGSTGYTYGASGGGGSSSSSGTNDKTIKVEDEPSDDPAIKVADYIKCFGTVPDANASYKISLYSDIPVDGDPSKMFDWSTASVGHSFIQLTKSSGTTTIQQDLGFYPNTSWKALGPNPTASKMVDNSGHEYNASLTLTISGIEFQAKLDRIAALQSSQYDIITYNCTNFALDIFNTGSAHPLSIPTYYSEGSHEPMKTPQSLYTQIQSLQTSGNTTYGTASVPKTELHASNGHGSCGSTTNPQ